MASKNSLFRVALASLIIMACAWSGAQRYIGKTLAPEDRHALSSPSGAHIISTNTFVLEERYRLDRGAGRVDIAGRIIYTFNERTHRFGTLVNQLSIQSIYVQALFADRTGKVIGVKSTSLHPDSPLMFPVDFQWTPELPADSEYMTFRLTTYMQNSDIVSRQISPTETEEYGYNVGDGGGDGIGRDPGGFGVR